MTIRQVDRATNLEGVEVRYSDGLTNDRTDYNMTERCCKLGLV